MIRCFLVSGVIFTAFLALPSLAEEAKVPDKEKGWVQLFNGKDLTGWKLHANPSKDITEVIRKEKDGKVIAFEGKLKDGKVVPLWHVENGILIGSGPASHLFSERGDYQNFEYRIEAQINDGGNSGQYFRTQFDPGFPKGYEAQINATHKDKIRTGSLYMPRNKELLVLDVAPHKPNEWFTQEVLADGDRIMITVNGKKTVDWKDSQKTYTKGHFALQGHDPGTTVQFRKIEIRELPATK
jgi:3-keto-disaccharide hydrolase